MEKWRTRKMKKKMHFRQYDRQGTHAKMHFRHDCQATYAKMHYQLLESYEERKEQSCFIK